MLEKKIEQPAIPQTPAGLSRVRAKLKEHQPITIVTMGDSLSDQHHWANRKVVWSSLLGDAFKAKHGSDVKIVNPAIGGTTLSQNVVLIPRWVKDAPSPDLVTILFGGNDWDNGVRGERFADYLRLAIDQIRRQTNGAADVLIMSTGPTHARWETYKELEAAARAVAAEKKTGYADFAGEFRNAGSSADEALKREFWVWDKVHLGPKGHERARDVVLRAIEAD
jgi:lysophospholipase L1-like esterase